jgi:O-antigen ligase
MAACPIISTSRGGALVTAAILAGAVILFAVTHFMLKGWREDSAGRRVGSLLLILTFVAAALLVGYHFGWERLAPRMAEIPANFEGREGMYDNARPMARDYPLFGTGPGTFEPVFQLYRESMDTYWPAQLHNDWLETRITFGWVGSALIGLAFLIVLARWFAPGGILGGRRFVILIWLAIGGCFAHARFDFPFQIHSILFLFLLLCAILFNLSRKG